MTLFAELSRCSGGCFRGLPLRYGDGNASAEQCTFRRMCIRSRNSRQSPAGSVSPLRSADGRRVRHSGWGRWSCVSDRLSGQNEGTKTEFNATETTIENLLWPIVGRGRAKGVSNRLSFPRAPRFFACVHSESLCSAALLPANPCRSRELAPSRTRSVLRIRTSGAFPRRRIQAAKARDARSRRRACSSSRRRASSLSSTILRDPDDVPMAKNGVSPACVGQDLRRRALTQASHLPSGTMRLVKLYRVA